MSPIATTTYGGDTGRRFTSIAAPLLPIAASAVSRCPLIAIASAPASHSALTSSSRSSSLTRRRVGVAALVTVIRTPSPVTATNPVRTCWRRWSPVEACSVLAVLPDLLLQGRDLVVRVEAHALLPGGDPVAPGLDPADQGAAAGVVDGGAAGGLHEGRGHEHPEDRDRPRRRPAAATRRLDAGAPDARGRPGPAARRSRAALGDVEVVLVERLLGDQRQQRQAAPASGDRVRRGGVRARPADAQPSGTGARARWWRAGGAPARRRGGRPTSRGRCPRWRRPSRRRRPAWRRSPSPSPSSSSGKA